MPESPTLPHAFPRFTGGRLAIASHNAGKVRELQAMLGRYGAELASAAELNIPEPEETGASFLENAELKARHAAICAGLPALADDSGLVVAALDGAPGIYSARWGGPAKDFQAAMRRVEESLTVARGHAEGAEAYFACALSFCWPDGQIISVEGRVHGTLTFPPRGEKGFGYDPIFQPRGHSLTFGEMDAEAKEAISHRADAFRQLVAAVF